MRSLIAAALTASLAAAPAHATQGLTCRPVAGTGPVLSLVLAAGGGIAVAHLTERGATRTTQREADNLSVRQSWIDRQLVWVDLGDGTRLGDEGRLRGTFVRGGRHWHVAGTFARGGRIYRVRCEES